MIKNSNIIILVTRFLVMNFFLFNYNVFFTFYLNISIFYNLLKIGGFLHLFMSLHIKRKVTIDAIIKMETKKWKKAMLS